MSVPTFTCAQCGDVCEFGDQEKALAEMRENFGELTEDERCIVCDDCYQAMVSIESPAEWRAKGGPEGPILADMLSHRPEAAEKLQLLIDKALLKRGADSKATVVTWLDGWKK